MALPQYFYDLVGSHQDLFELTGSPTRWSDPFVNPDGSERLVLSQSELNDNVNRNRHYYLWLAAFGLNLRNQLRFQAIQILDQAWDHQQRSDWWREYKDALFRVFQTPETKYDHYTKEHKQFYIISPEDGELMHRYELQQKGIVPPPLKPKGEFISQLPALRRARFVPVECCRHWRNETTAGELPDGL